MSKVIRELQQEKRNLLAELQELQTRTSSEGRAMTSDENATFDKVNERITEVEKSIRNQQALDERLKEIALENAPQEQPQERKVDYGNAFWKYQRNGFAGLDAAEQKMVAEKRGTNDQITTTDSLGGYLVPEGFGDQIIMTMKHYSGMLQASNIFRTATGNPVPFPTLDDTANTGALIGEGVADTVSDLTYGVKNLNAYTYTSRVIKWSYELIQDAAFDLEGHTRDVASERLGRILNSQLTSGDGSSKPNGILNAASAGKTAASTSAITREEIVDLIHSVDRAYRQAGNTALMMHDSTLAAIRKLAFGSADDRPLYQAGNAQTGEPGTIEGQPFVINNDFDELSDGASSSVIAFGDWSKYYVRIVNDMQMVRLNERYAEERVIGYFVYLRADGELLDSASIKLLNLAAS